jgi:hypothetical protein
MKRNQDGGGAQRVPYLINGQEPWDTDTSEMPDEECEVCEARGPRVHMVYHGFVKNKSYHHGDMSQYHWQHKSVIGFANAIAVTRRAHLAPPHCPARGLTPMQSTLPILPNHRNLRLVYIWLVRLPFVEGFRMPRSTHVISAAFSKVQPQSIDSYPNQ